MIPGESPFDRQTRIPWWDQQKLSGARILVAGAGALGNEVLKNLALIGVGRILVVDFDTVEDSNLSRSVLFRQGDISGRKVDIAAARAQQINPNPGAIVHAIHGDLVWELGDGVYRHVDVVLGCLDNVEARLKLNENCWKANVPWIDGGMYGLSGSVAVYDADAERACYECGMDDDAYRRARERYSCTGQAVKANIKKGREPTTQTTSALIAALQSQEAIKLLHGLESFAGRKVVYQGYSQNFALPNPSAFMLVQLAVNPDCLCHAYQSRYEAVLELPWASADTTTAHDLLTFARDTLGYQEPYLELGREFVIKAICPVCERVTPIERPSFRLTDVDLACPECEATCPMCGTVSQGVPNCPHCGQDAINERRAVTFHQLQFNNEERKAYLAYPLAELGIPPLHILGLRDATGAHTLIELSGDLDKVFGLRAG